MDDSPVSTISYILYRDPWMKSRCYQFPRLTSGHCVVIQVHGYFGVTHGTLRTYIYSTCPMDVQVTTSSKGDRVISSMLTHHINVIPVDLLIGREVNIV